MSASDEAREEIDHPELLEGDAQPPTVADHDDVDPSDELIEVGVMESIFLSLSERFGDAYVKGVEQQVEIAKIRLAGTRRQQEHQLELAKIEAETDRQEIDRAAEADARQAELKRDQQGKAFWLGLAFLAAFVVVAYLGHLQGDIASSIDVLEKLLLLAAALVGAYKWGKSETAAPSDGNGAGGK